SFQRAIELIGKRWTGAVVKALIPAPARFNQLLAGIPGISDRVLTERLRELETEGIVERLVDPGPPVRVSYRLTSRGRALEPVLSAVSEWAESWLRPPAAAVGSGPRPKLDTPHGGPSIVPALPRRHTSIERKVRANRAQSWLLRGRKRDVEHD